MPPILTAVLSIAALLISLLTAWLSFFRRGTVRMTRPTIIYFGPDSERDKIPKIYFRTLLFATAKRGRVLESMYVRIRRSDTIQNFTTWVHGDQAVVRGSGLHVPETGVVTTHQFLIGDLVTPFAFNSGQYELEVIATIVGDRANKLLFRTLLELSYQSAVAIADLRSGVSFDWSPDSGRYTERVQSIATVPAVATPQ